MYAFQYMDMTYLATCRLSKGRYSGMVAIWKAMNLKRNIV